MIPLNRLFRELDRNLNLGPYAYCPKVSTLSKTMSEQSAQDAVDNARLEQLIRENTELTKSMHRVLMGEPEYKRPGIVEIVDRHDKLLTKGGGAFFAFYTLWEIIKYFHPRFMP